MENNIETVEETVDMTIALASQIKSSAGIPDVLVVNGVETSAAIIATLKQEVLAMQVNGITDTEGYDNAVAKLSLVKKTRTSTEGWRKDLVAPLLKFQKDLKERVDKDALEFKAMEEHLNTIILPVKNFKEEERLRLEKERDELAEERAKEVVALGGVFDGKGTYNFTHDADIFILAANLRSFSPEAYEEAMIDIRASWEDHQSEINAKKAADEKEKQDVIDQQNALNEKRTRLRIKELYLEDFYETAPGIYSKEESKIIVTTEDVLNLEDEAWDLLLNPVEAPEVSDVKTPVEAPAVKTEEEVFVNPFANKVITDIINDDEEIKPKESEVPAVNEVKVVLTFTKTNPFIEFKLNANLFQRIFPKGNVMDVQSDLEEATYQFDKLNDDLDFIVFKK